MCDHFLGRFFGGRARGIEAQAKQATLQLTDLSQREAALAALSRAASATGNIALFREIFGRAFGLGEELFQEDLDSHPGQTALSAFSGRLPILVYARAGGHICRR
jgi:hypothetical protein